MPAASPFATGQACQSWSPHERFPMSIGAADLALYTLALVVLAVTPGPVMAAIIARALSGQSRSALPLAFGVVFGDLLWPLLAIFGLAAIATIYGEIMQLLRLVGAAILIWMGWRLVAKRRGGAIAPDPMLMHRDSGRAFMAGLFVGLGNPKTILFFMGLLPGFFHIPSLTLMDIAVIVLMSGFVLLLGNILWGIGAHHARLLLSTPRLRARVDRISGGTLIGAGAYIAAG